jgi:hypothetical protein
MKDYNIKQSLIIVAVGCGLLLIGLYLFSPWFGGPARNKTQTTQLEEAELAKAISHYQALFQQFPTNDNAGLVKSMTGDNTKQLTFLNLGTTSTNEAGQLIDIWSTPYKFAFNSTNSFTITSAGENHTFGDADDVVFNSASNTLPAP